MKFWIPGVDGELGACVVQAAKDAGHDPIGTTHGQCSIEDPAQVFAAVENIRPDVIINCVRKQPGSNPIEMLMANAVGPHVLASTKVWLVHMSTDCVFSGSHAHGEIKIWYSSKAFPDPDTLYGRSKLAGEPKGSHVLVVRGSYLGIRSSFMQWLLNAKGPVELWKNAYWNVLMSSLWRSIWCVWQKTREQESSIFLLQITPQRLRWLDISSMC